MGLLLTLPLLLQLLDGLVMPSGLTLQPCFCLGTQLCKRSYLQRWQQAQLGILLQLQGNSLAWGVKADRGLTSRSLLYRSELRGEVLRLREECLLCQPSEKTSHDLRSQWFRLDPMMLHDVEHCWYRLEPTCRLWLPERARWGWRGGVMGW